VVAGFFSSRQPLIEGGAGSLIEGGGQTISQGSAPMARLIEVSDY